MKRLLLVVLLFGAGSCQSKKKAPPRTEPWPAPLASASNAPAAARRLSYVIEPSVVRIELSARKRKPHGTLSQIEGTIEWDPARPEQVHAEIRADLLSLSFGYGDGEDPELLARALDWLEVSPSNAAEQRERDRYAVLRISSCDGGAEPGGATARGTTTCTARGDLTLHRFRVPVAVDVSITAENDGSDAPGTILIRMRKPLVVPLARYDIQPRNAQGEVLPAELASVGNEVGRDARVFAELRARRTTARPQNQ